MNRQIDETMTDKEMARQVFVTELTELRNELEELGPAKNFMGAVVRTVLQMKIDAMFDYIKNK